MNNFCGLDFGTSNSSIGFYSDNALSLAFFNDRPYIPSSIFFEHDEEQPAFGREAIVRYIEGHEGRMMWSPKNALGTKLINEKTQVKDQQLSFKDIISLIIKNLKERCEEQSKRNLTSIVVGRPVFYNDKDSELDREAENAMRDILIERGFKHVEFAYEPIAAAACYEHSLHGEEIALIVDMGGGTSDFTVAKLNNNNENSSEKILSIGGIHSAGTNFDRSLSLYALMPELGLAGKYKTLEGKWAVVPPTLHKDLATWHKIGFCYNKANILYAKNKIYSAEAPEKFSRLAQVLEHRLGHQLAIAVEHAKISLSVDDQAVISLRDVEPAIELSVTKKQLEESITDHVQQILAVVKKTINDAKIHPSSVTSIFMTGGASMVPIIRNSILAVVPQAKLIDGDKFASVATGLTLLSAQRFR